MVQQWKSELLKKLTRNEISATYWFVLSRKAHVVVALWLAVVCLENEGESVAWRQYGLVARVISVRRIHVATKLFQDFIIIENLKDHIKDKIIIMMRSICKHACAVLCRSITVVFCRTVAPLIRL